MKLRHLSSILATCAFLAGPAVAPAGAWTPDLPLKAGDSAGLVGIGHGREMFLECYGKGWPTVILDSGLRNGAGVWAQPNEESPPGPTVFPGVARFTRVCSYDRPGTIATFAPLEFSRSSAVAMPRTAAGAVSDLHELLKAARVPGPYVMVSHSTGGLIDRLYAATYPREVAGLVLVDGLAEFFEDKLTPEQLSGWEALNNGPIEGLDYPDLERYDFRASFAQTRRATHRHPLPDIPYTVLSHGKPFALPESLPNNLSSAVIERAWTFAQDRLASLVPDAVHIIAKHSSHYILYTQPKLVIDQTRRVVLAVRRGSVK